MDHLPQPDAFFGKKKHYFKFYVLFGPFYWAKLKNSQSGSRDMKSHHFQVQYGLFAQDNIFFGKSINLIFMYLLASFIIQNFKKIIRSKIIRTHHFQAQNGPSAPNDNFFWKTITIISMYLLVPFIVQNFEKILWANPFLGPKWPACPETDFFQKTH